MQTINIRRDLVQRLISLNKKHKYLLSVDTNQVDWSNLKVDIQNNLKSLKKSAKVYEILAYILLGITAVIAFIKLFGDNNTGPDLNKGALFIFLTVTNTFSAFSYKLRLERLEKQILLLDLLEKMNNTNDK